jgi:hypothetical protein
MLVSEWEQACSCFQVLATRVPAMLCVVEGAVWLVEKERKSETRGKKKGEPCFQPG